MRQQDKSSAMITDAARLSGLCEGTVSHRLGKPIAFSDRTRTRVEEAIRTLDNHLSKTVPVLSSPYACMARSPSGTHLATREFYPSLDKFTAAPPRDVTSALQPKASHP
jgi:Bacterial regulatory proteins, lacI family